HRAQPVALVLPRAAVDVEPLGRVLELLLRLAPRPFAMRPDAAAAAGRDIPRRAPRGRAGLASASALLVHGARGALLGPILGHPALLGAVLDVLVLAGALRALLDSTRWHLQTPL